MIVERIGSDRKFHLMMEAHAHDVIEYLIKHGITFSIFCPLSSVHFDPPLPQKIRSHFSNITLFVLAGYTFESIILNRHDLCFEAGFGEENFGSLVRVPLGSILQILIQDDNGEDHALFTSLSAAFDGLGVDLDPNSDEEGLQSSIASLLSNPENQKFKKH
ncbi:MAG: hypothetical protein ACTTH5_08010 [Wolinella sp.]